MNHKMFSLKRVRAQFYAFEIIIIANITHCFAADEKCYVTGSSCAYYYENFSLSVLDNIRVYFDANLC